MVRNAVAILPAQSKTPQPDPVVFMTGGPGAAAILDIPFLVEAGINRNNDLIVMAQRGTLYDTPELFCPELDRFYARQVSMVYDAPSTGTKQAAAARACHNRPSRGGGDQRALQAGQRRWPGRRQGEVLRPPLQGQEPRPLPGTRHPTGWCAAELFEDGCE